MSDSITNNTSSISMTSAANSNNEDSKNNEIEQLKKKYHQEIQELKVSSLSNNKFFLHYFRF